MQVFNQSPRAWRPTKYTSADFEAARARLAESTVDSIFIHAVYLINCASRTPLSAASRWSRWHTRFALATELGREARSSTPTAARARLPRKPLP